MAMIKSFPAGTPREPDPRAEIWDIDPDIAGEWLLRNTNNRPRKPNAIERYGRDMLAGCWYLTHQGIAFSVENVLIDGQNRLYAVVETGCTIRSFVFFDLPLSTQRVVDDHTRRTHADSLHMTGQRVNKSDVAVAQAMYYGANVTNQALSKLEMEEFYTRNHEAIDFVHTCFPTSKRGIPAAARSVWGRAWHTCDHGALFHAAEVLLNGIMVTSLDQTIITLRNALLTTKVSGRGVHRSAVYRKTQNAVKAYINGQVLTKLYAADVELFPLPGE